jgi:aldose 1-epimerase
MRDASGPSLELSHGGYRAAIATVGAGLRTLTHDGRDLVAGYAADEVCPDYRGWVLSPWPNRVADGRYDFEGRRLQLALNEPESRNALHGLAGWVAWSVVEQTPRRVALRHELVPQPGYPFALDLDASYELSDGGLRVTLAATNAGRTRAPYGVGHHPYLTVGRPVDECELTVPAGTWVPMDDRGHPGEAEPVDGTPYDFRKPRRIGDLRLDNPFGDLDLDGGAAVATLHDPDSGRTVRVRAEAPYRWLHVFTSDTHGEAARRSLAVEPTTCPPDAFRSGSDLVVLEPGETHTASYSIDAGAAAGG